MRFLLDTNIISESAAKAPDGKVLCWLEEHSEECALSALSLGEIWKGIHLLPAGKRKRARTRWADDIARDFSAITLALDSDVLRVWAKLCATHEAKESSASVTATEPTLNPEKTRRLEAFRAYRSHLQKNPPSEERRASLTDYLKECLEDRQTFGGREQAQ